MKELLSPIAWYNLDFVSGLYSKKSQYVFTKKAGNATDFDFLLKHQKGATLTCTSILTGIPQKHILQLDRSKPPQYLQSEIELRSTLGNSMRPVIAKGRGKVVTLSQQQLIVIYKLQSLELFVFENQGAEVSAEDDYYAQYERRNEQLIAEMIDLRKRAANL